MEKLGYAFLGLIAVTLLVIFGVGCVGGVVYICSLVWGFEFSWLLTLGVCGILILLRWATK